MLFRVQHYEDHPVTRRDITAVELAAVHHELAVDPLRWFSGFGRENWHSTTAVFQQLQVLIQMGYTTGTYDQLNLGGIAAMEVPRVLGGRGTLWLRVCDGTSLVRSKSSERLRPISDGFVVGR